jgi:hypothetical protein
MVALITFKLVDQRSLLWPQIMKRTRAQRGSIIGSRLILCDPAVILYNRDVSSGKVKAEMHLLVPSPMVVLSLFCDDICLVPQHDKWG